MAIDLEMEKGTDVVKRKGHTASESDIDRGHAWVVLAATFASFFITGGFLLTSGIVHTALLAKFGDSLAKTSWAGSVFLAAMSLTAPIGAAIVDRYSCRAAVMVGSAMLTVGFIATGLAPNVEFCIVSYGIVAGTGGGITWAVLFVVNGFNFRKRLNLAQGISLSGTGMGLFALAPVFEASKAEFGHTGLFFVLAGFSMQLFVFGALLRPSSLERQLKSMRNPGQNSRSQTSVDKFKDNLELYSRALCNIYILLIALSMFFFCGGIYAMFLHWPNFCLHQGFSPMQSSIALSIVGFVSIFGRFGTGLLASFRYVSERIVYSGSMALLGASLIVFFLYANTFPGHIAQAVIVGLLNGSAYVLITSLTARGCGVQFLSAAVGIEFMFGGVGAIAFPIISGYMIEGGFSYQTVFIMCGLCLILASVLGFGTKFVQNRCADETATNLAVIIIEPEQEGLVVKTGVEDNTLQLSATHDGEKVHIR